jgi:outer membrane lipoprotein-sorting protein
MRVLALAGFLAPLLCAQTRPDVAGLLGKVSGTYSHAAQYRFAIRKTGEEAGSLQIAVQKPDKFRLEADGRVIDGVDAFGNVVMVSNGSTVWNYVGESQQYTKKRTTLPLLDTEPPEITPEAFVLQAETVFLRRYAQFAQATDHARYLRQETLTTPAGPVPCAVIELRAPLPAYRDTYTWWIDPKRSLVLREDTRPATNRRPPSTVVYSLASIGEPMPPEIFQFTPPAGATQVDRFE